jgi:hypothetical protein
MTGPSLVDRWRRMLAGPGVPETQGREAARLLIAGDVDGALVAATQASTARNSMTSSDGFAVLAWVHLVRGERDKAEAAASVARRIRTPDRLLTVALVVAAGGPSAGAAVAFTETSGVLSIVAATRVFADHGVLVAVRTEIATLTPEMEQAALERLQVGLVALGRRSDVDEVSTRLAALGRTPARDAVHARAAGRFGMTDLALGYLQLAADHGYADLDGVMDDPDLAEARGRPSFAAIRDDIAANARSNPADSGS